MYISFPDKICSLTTGLILLSHGASINFFIWRSFFSSDFFIYQLDFSVVWTMNILSSCIFFPSLLFHFLFWMLWMLFSVDKLKNMACHGPHTSQMTFNRIIVMKFLFSVSNEESLALVTHILSNNLEKHK